MRKFAVKSFLLVVIISFLFSAHAFADTLFVEETQVTDTFLYETTPTLSNDVVVYTARELLNTGFFDQGDIWYQDLNDLTVGPVQITSDITDDKLNDVSGDYVVYTAYDTTMSSTGTIMLYQISTGILQPIGDPLVIQEPRIHADTVVWVQGAVGSSEVMVYNLAWLGTTHAAESLTGPIPPTSNVDIGDRFAVWVEKDGDYDIGAWDFENLVRIKLTDTPLVDERHPSTSGDWIVWESRDHGASNKRIEAVNLETGDYRIIINDGSVAARPSVHGDLIAYESDLKGNKDIYVYRISTLETFAVTTSPKDEYLSDVFGDLVAHGRCSTPCIANGVGYDDEDVWVASLQFCDESVGDADLIAISETKLSAIDAAGGDTFGHSVAFSGDVAVAGAPLEDAKGSSSGSAYVFRYNTATTSWDHEAKLTASDGASFDVFGQSVAISGDRVVVGAVSDDHVVTNAGSAYVFKHVYIPPNGGPGDWIWVEEAKLTASDAATGDLFGQSVAIDGDVAVVAAPFDDSNTGSVYVFRYNTGTGWAQEAKLVGADSVAGDKFGYSVAISGDRVVVGAALDDDGASNAGSAYVFRYNTATTSWDQEAKLTASDAAAGDNFGQSVAINGTTVAIGSPFAQGSGSVYVFIYLVNGPGHWGQQAKLTASDAAAGQLFGIPIAIYGDTIVAGAIADGHAGSYSGSAYVFGYSDFVWSEKAKLTASDAAAYDNFGMSVAVSGDKVMVGAPYDGDAGTNSGSAYVYELAADTPVDNCIVVRPIDERTGTSPVTLTFSQVAVAGITTLNTSSEGPPPPAGWQVSMLPIYYDITTTADAVAAHELVAIKFEKDLEQTQTELKMAVFWYDVVKEEWKQALTILQTSSEIKIQAVAQMLKASLFAIFEPIELPVTIDIKPGSDPNCFNINGHGVIPVAILGSGELDVTQIDVSSLKFAGLDVRVKGNGNAQCSVEDVNGDPHLDLVCQFVDDSTSWSPDNGTASVTGSLLPEYGGIEFSGTDSICLRPE